MKQTTKLNFGMYTLYLIIFVVFGLIIVNEKLTILIMPKFENYFNEEYKEISHQLDYNELQEENEDFYLTVYNIENKDLNFKITYSNQEFISTYQKDYIEGNSIITKLEDKYSTDEYKFNIKKKLNEYSDEIKTKILEDNFLDLSIYELEQNLYLNDYSTTGITNEIINTQVTNLNPSNYNYVITNNNDIVESIQINNLTKDIINSPNFYLVISDILNNLNTELLQVNNITYEHLN